MLGMKDSTPDTRKPLRTTRRVIHRDTGWVFHIHYENGRYVGLTMDTTERDEVPESHPDDSLS